MNRLTGLSKLTLFGIVLALLLQVATAETVNGGGEWPTHQVYTLLHPRGTYLLDFDKIYETVASLDVETAVTLPPGYTFTLNRPGSIDYINAFVIQNTLFFTRTIDHGITTSIVCNVVTPTNETKNLIFKIRGGAKNDPVVYAIHFAVEAEITSAEPVIIEKSCLPEVETAVSRKERELNESVYRTTMVGALPAFFKKHRGSMKKTYNGATAYINGVIYTRGEAYVYIYSNVRKDQCDIVKLLKIRQGKNELHVDLVDTYEQMDGTWAYVYKTPLQQPARNKRTKIRFILEIWSKTLTYKAVIS